MKQPRNSSGLLTEYYGGRVTSLWSPCKLEGMSKRLTLRHDIIYKCVGLHSKLSWGSHSMAGHRLNTPEKNSRTPFFSEGKWFQHTSHHSASKSGFLLPRLLSCSRGEDSDQGRYRLMWGIDCVRKRANWQIWPRTGHAPVSYNNNWPGRKTSTGAIVANIMGVTSHFLLGFKTRPTRQNSCLVPLAGPRTQGYVGHKP